MGMPRRSVTIGVIVVSVIIAILLIILYARRESFTPLAILTIGDSGTFNDYGFGTPLVQTSWSGKGTLFQPFVALDQGLYTSDKWGPRTNVARMLPAECRK